MKQLRPLTMEELSTEQKIGMTLMGDANNDEFEYAMELVRKRAIGTIWVGPRGDGSHREIIRRIREEADYPILIIADMESGYGDYLIGRQYALGLANDENLTYRFARAMAAAARADGYSGICGPILERGIHNCTPTRGFGGDHYQVLRHARAFIRGYLDAGILPICKHYPSSEKEVDTHLIEGLDDRPEEEILNTSLYTWIKLNEEGLLKGMMTGHSVLNRVDPENPTTLSKPVIDLLRSRGYDGFTITDDLSMLGICAKYGDKRFSGSVIAGNDVLLEWRPKSARPSVEAAVASGELTMERLNEAARHVIEAQSLYMEEPKFTSSPEDIQVVEEVNKRSIAAILDEGLEPSIPAEGRHLFMVMVPSVPTYFNPVAYNAEKVEAQIRKRFPNSDIAEIHEYPSNKEMYDLSHQALEYDSVVMVLYTEFLCYTGGEALTSRVIAMVGSMAGAGRLSGVLFFGNSRLLSSLPHIRRLIVGCNNLDNNLFCVDALAGLIRPTGALPMKVDLA